MLANVFFCLHLFFVNFGNESIAVDNLYHLLSGRYPSLKVVKEWKLYGFVVDIAVLNSDNIPMALFELKTRKSDLSKGEEQLNRIRRATHLIADLYICIKIADSDFSFYKVTHEGALLCDQLPKCEALEQSYEVNSHNVQRELSIKESDEKKKFIRHLCWKLIPIVWGLLFAADIASYYNPCFSGFRLTQEKIVFCIIMCLCSLFPFVNMITFKDFKIFVNDENNKKE